MIRKYGNDLEWFFSEIIIRKKKQRIERQLDLGDVVSNAFLVGSSKGNAVYNTWMQEKKKRLEEIDKERNMTVFDKLKRAGRTNTLFHKLKYVYDKRNN